MLLFALIAFATLLLHADADCTIQGKYNQETYESQYVVTLDRAVVLTASYYMVVVIGCYVDTASPRTLPDLEKTDTTS
jgi:hypothetical protein